MNKSFRLWVESHDVNMRSRRQNYFNQVMQVLQATRDDLSKPLTNLPSIRSPKPEDGEAQPPQKGAGVLTKVQNLLGNVLHAMSNDRADTETTVRAKRTMDVLRTRSNDSVVKPVMYLQDLLKELFGTNFFQEFINQSQDVDDTQQPNPDDNAMVKPQQNPSPDLNDPNQQPQMGGLSANI